MNSGHAPSIFQNFLPFTLEATGQNDHGRDSVCRPKEKLKTIGLFPLKPAFRPFKQNLPVTNFVGHKRNQRHEQALDTGLAVRGRSLVDVESEEQEDSAILLSTGPAAGCVQENATLRAPSKKPGLELSLNPSTEPSTNNGEHRSSIAGQSKRSGFGSSSRTAAKYRLPLTLLCAPTAGQLAAYTAALLSNHNRRPSTRHGPRPRSSSFRGVTHYKRTGRWEAHIWNKGKQIYLGASSTAEKAARAYDRAALHFRKLGAELNFYLQDYAEELTRLVELSEVQLVTMLRRQSAGVGRPQPEYPPKKDAPHTPRLLGDEGEVIQGDSLGSSGAEFLPQEMQVDLNSVPSTDSFSGTTAQSLEAEGNSTLHLPQAAHISERRGQYLQVIDNMRGRPSASSGITEQSDGQSP